MNSTEDKVIDLLDQVLTTIQTQRQKNYGTAPMPCERDRLLMKLMRMFIVENDEVRNMIIQLMGNSNVLLTFSYRMSILSVRTESLQYLRYGLAALVVEQGQDYRDTLFRLCLINHSAILLNANAKELLLEAANLVDKSSKIAHLLKNYADESPEKKRLELMGVKEGTSKDGFLYLPCSK